MISEKPPASNTGVLIQPTTYSFCLDYLRYSVNVDVPLTDVTPPWECFEFEGEALQPLKNYNTARKLAVGRVDWHTDRPEQKQLITLSGSDLTMIGVLGFSVPELLEYVMKLPGVKITRIDFAMDIKNGSGKPRDLHLAMQTGDASTRAQTSTLIEGRRGKDDIGETVYIGSRTSDKFMRVYDKAKERGDFASDHIRCELELKGGYARVGAAAMLRHGLVEGGKALMRQFIVTGLDWIDDGLIAEFTGAYVEPVPHDLSNHDAWVLAVALPAVLRAIAEDLPGVREEVNLALEHIWKQRRKLQNQGNLRYIDNRR